MNLQERFNLQKSAFREQNPMPLAMRKEHLHLLDRILNDHEKEWIETLHKDFQKPAFETFITEISIVRKEIEYHLKNLQKWTKPERVKSFVGNMPSRDYLYPQAYGVCLIIGAWNYPVNLILQPLVGALSAGNCVVLKPSELASHTAALLTELVERYFDPSVLTVVQGDGEISAELTAMPFDLIMYTGSSQVGRLVMKAAAENLTPVILELGGKSPAIVHDDADMTVTARRIWWGKCLNAGQTCVAPDYVMVHESVKEVFIAASKRVLGEFYPDASGANPQTRFADMARIINDRHFNRITKLFTSKEAALGGFSDAETRFIEPTLVEVDREHPLMSEEIFGPVLPLITYRNSDEVVEFVNSGETPLAFYAFTKNQAFAQDLVQRIPFGGGCVNDTIAQLANLSLPFGGQGNSGMGAYHGKTGFEAFSRKKPVVHRSFSLDVPVKYPPYSESKLGWIRRLLKFA